MTYTYAGSYQEETLDSTGRPLRHAAIAVRLPGTTTLATTVYTSRTKAAQAANPVATDANGNLAFFAEPGSYDLAFNGGIVPIVVLPDLADIGTEAEDVAINAAIVGHAAANPAHSAAHVSVATAGLAVISHSDGQGALADLDAQFVNDHLAQTVVLSDRTGTTDASAVLSAADLSAADKYLPPGTYKVSSNLTLTGRWRFAQGAVLRPASGVTVSLFGQVEAGATQIFDITSGGSVSLTGFATAARPEWWGAKGDWQQVADGAIDPGADGTLLNSPSAPFTSASVGKNVGLTKIVAGAADVAVTTTITAYISPTQVRLAAALVGAARTGITVQWWTNDQAAMSACFLGISTAMVRAVELRGVSYVLHQEASQNSSLRVRSSGTVVRGVPGSTWLKHPTGISRPGGLTLVQVIGFTDVTFVGVGFDGNWGNDGTVDAFPGINQANQGDPKNDLMQIRNSSNVTLRDCRFRQAYGDFVWLGASQADTYAHALATAPTNTIIDGCVGDMSARDAVVFGGPIDGVQMSHCKWTTIRIQALDTEPVGTWGFARNVDIDHCLFGGWWNPNNPTRLTNSLVSICGGFDSQIGPTNYAWSYRFTNNRVLGGTISVFSARNILIEGNDVVLDFPGTASAPILVDHYSDDVRIVNNMVYDRAARATTTNVMPGGSNTTVHDAAITVQRSNDSTPLQPNGVRISGNRIFVRNGNMGIAVEGTGSQPGVVGTASAVTDTTLTDGTQAWTTNQWQTYDVVCGTAIGRIGSNTATVLTVIAWTDPMGVAVATPAAGAYAINGASGLVDIDSNLVDCTDDGNGAGGEGIFIYNPQGIMRAVARNNRVRNATNYAIDVRTSNPAGHALAFLALLDNHAWDDRPTPLCSTTVNFRSSTNITQMYMRGNTAGVGVAGIVTGLTAGVWRTGGDMAPTWAGFGSPESVVTAPVGSLYQRVDGTTDSAVYRKETGTGSTGWVAVSQVSTTAQVHARGEKTDADQTVTSSTTLVDAGGLSFAVDANTVWAYEFVVYYDGSTAGDIRFNIPSPTGATRHIYGAIGLGVGASSAQASTTMFSASPSSPPFSMGTVGPTVRCMAIIRGVTEVAATPGVIKLQFAQSTSDPTATTVFRGSHFVAHRVSP